MSLLPDTSSDTRERLTKSQQPRIQVYEKTREVYKTRARDWRSDLCYNTYVPISADDLYNLYTYADMVRLYAPARSPGSTRAAPRHRDPNTLFFANHPIRYVQVSGRVLHTVYAPAEAHPARSRLSLSDGSGPNSLECLSEDRYLSECAPASVGDIVCVWGHISSIDSAVVVVHRVFVFHPHLAGVYYHLRQQAMLTRKYVLEWSAEAFDHFLPPLAAGQRPTSSLVELTMLKSQLLDCLFSKCTSSANVLDVVNEKPVKVWP